MTLLDLNAVDVRYGPIRAVDAISLHVRRGEIVTLLGANGAGKTSTLRAIMGMSPVTAGTVKGPGGENLVGRRTEWIAKHCHYAFVPEGRGLFPRMTVYDNLEIGAYSRRHEGHAWLVDAIDRVFGVFPTLAERRKQSAGTLSGGEQQMLAIGRALITEPQLLLLDEPSHGLAPKIVREMFERLQAINASGTGILLVEQNSRLALKVSSRGYVLERGSIVVEGECQDLRLDDRIRRAYLGVGAN